MLSKLYCPSLTAAKTETRVQQQQQQHQQLASREMRAAVLTLAYTCRTVITEHRRFDAVCCLFPGVRDES